MRLSVFILMSMLGMSTVFASTKDQSDSFDEFDQLDKADFQEKIAKADGCTRARDFSCTEQALAEAAKLVTEPKDKKMLQLARNNLKTERDRVEEEERQRRIAEERERERERLRKRQIAEEEEAENNRRRVAAYLQAQAQHNADVQAKMASGDCLSLFGADMLECQNRHMGRWVNDAQQKQAQIDADARQRQEDQLRQQRQWQAQEDQRQQRILEEQQREARYRMQQQQEQQQPRENPSSQSYSSYGQGRGQGGGSSSSSVNATNSMQMETVVGYGKSDYCYTKEQALDLADTNAHNDADKTCSKLGSRSRLGSKTFPGYQQCTPCSGAERGNYRCNVEKVVFECFHN